MLYFPKILTKSGSVSLLKGRKARRGSLLDHPILKRSLYETGVTFTHLIFFFFLNSTSFMFTARYAAHIHSANARILTCLSSQPLPSFTAFYHLLVYKYTVKYICLKSCKCTYTYTTLRTISSHIHADFFSIHNNYRVFGTYHVSPQQIFRTVNVQLKNSILCRNILFTI